MQSVGGFVLQRGLSMIARRRGRGSCLGVQVQGRSWASVGEGGGVGFVGGGGVGGGWAWWGRVGGWGPFFIGGGGEALGWGVGWGFWAERGWWAWP